MGGWTDRWLIYRSLSVVATGQLVRAGRTVLKGFIISNTNAADVFVKFYNTATAPVVGTDTPVMTLMLIGNSEHILSDADLFFDTGLGLGATTAVADNSTAAPSANDIVANLFYVPVGAL